MINEHTTGWKTGRMNKVDLSVLRLAVYEMKWDDEVTGQSSESMKQLSWQRIFREMRDRHLSTVYSESLHKNQKIMRNVYTVKKQVNAYIKNMFTQDFMLNRIYIKGEVSNCKYHTSGHLYFSLKDESGTIACVMFAGQRSGLSFRMQEGQQVIVLGSVSVYERDGRYQVYAKEIVLDGAGLLYEKLLKLQNESWKKWECLHRSISSRSRGLSADWEW